jgi:CO/xanthine dehydrogenase Mo-binding subunit
MTTNSTTYQGTNYNVVGTRPIRHDGYDKVTGAAKYGADIQLSDMLFAKILRSPHAHALIKSIDTSKALKLPGVKSVMTHQDFPIIKDKIIDLAETRANARLMAEHLMAHTKVLYKGHAVAAVAATNAHTAELALELIDVEYEILPAALTLAEAIKPNAPLLHPTMTTHFKAERFARGEDQGNNSNIASHIQHKLGDTDQGFSDADFVIEREFTTETVHQGYIEPHASTATWPGDGRVHIWTCTQGAFGVRSATAAILGLEESMIKVTPTEIGGGFGAKATTYLEPVAAVLSQKSGKPVKVVMSRKDVFEGTGPTSATWAKSKIGFTNKGLITSAQITMYFEAGAYPGSPVGGATLCATGPYKIENLLIDGYDVVCNKQKVQAYRAPGQPQGAFCVEPIIDEAAIMLGIDPIDLRLLNAVKEGDRMPNGVQHPKIGCIELEQAMKDHPHYQTPLNKPNQGRGIAVGYRWQGGQVSSATINVNTNGTINLITGSVDIGGSRTAVAMQAAEILGLTSDEVSPTVADTDMVGYTGNTGGSRTAFDTGLAAIEAANLVIQEMKTRASLIWEVQPQDILFENGTFTCAKNSNDQLSFKDLARRQMGTGGPITCSTSAPSTGVGPVVAGTIADVEVDPETGKVEILRCTSFLDVGFPAHPSYVEGQIQGATVQGIGWALNEEYVYNANGSLDNASFLDYRMPTSLDVPMIDSVMVTVPNPRHPFGLRGVGEAPIIPPLSAIHNAINDALGVRINSLPITPSKILSYLKKLK